MQSDWPTESVPVASHTANREDYRSVPRSIAARPGFCRGFFRPPRFQLVLGGEGRPETRREVPIRWFLLVPTNFEDSQGRRLRPVLGTCRGPSPREELGIASSSQPEARSRSAFRQTQQQPSTDLRSEDSGIVALAPARRQIASPYAAAAPRSPYGAPACYISVKDSAATPRRRHRRNHGGHDQHVLRHLRGEFK